MKTSRIYLAFVMALAVFVLCIGFMAGVAAWASPVLPVSFPQRQPAAAPNVSTSVVISEFRTRGPNAGNDEFVELYNLTGSPIDISGWKINGSSSCGTTIGTRVVISANTSIPAYGHFLATNSLGYSGLVPGDQTYSSSIADAGGIALLNSANVLIDAVGMCSSTTYFEGTSLPALGTDTNRSYERKPGGAGGSWQDTDNNVNDFQITSPSDPQNLSSTPVPPSTLTATGTSTYTFTRTNTPTITPTNTSTNTPGTSTNTPALTPTFTRTATPTSTSTFTVTMTGTPANTSTFTPTVFTSTATPTRTATNTSTSTPTSIPGQPDVEIYMLYTNAYGTPTPQTDEAVRLINVGDAPADLSNWLITNQTGSSIAFPAGSTLAPGQKIWVANQATSFRTYFGFNPDYEYGADTDPTVPQATAPAGYAFNDSSSTSGGSVRVRDGSGANIDTLLYGNATSATGWSGPAVTLYTNSQYANVGQIFYRKLDEISALPVFDTDTLSDWANNTGDNIDAKKLLRPGWALTDPSNEDMFFTKTYTETGVTSKFLVAPDNIYDPVRSLVISATTVISIEAYEWRAPFLITELIAAKNRGVTVNIVLDGNPCCGSPPRPDDATLYSAQQFENAGIPVYFFNGDQNTPSDEYRYNNIHAKFMIVDGTWLTTGSENFSYNSMPPDNKANGTRGNRGAFIITNAPNVVAYARRLFNFDFTPGKYPDLVRYPAVGTPSPGYTPAPFGDPTSYLPVKPTPLVMNENETFEVVQSPDNELRNQGSLIGLVNTAGAGDTVMVEQQYERKYWQSNTTTGPNPRLEAYIAAAQRGATVRILLDGSDRNDCSTTGNPATVDYVSSFGLSNLQAKIATPTADNIHNKLVLVQHNGVGVVHMSSINGSENSSKDNREFGLQITSNAAYLYYKDVFDYDWAHTLLSTCFSTPTVTSTPPGGLSATPTATFTPTVITSVTATGTPTDTPTPTPTGPHIVISEFRTNGPNGGNDEFVELYNPTSAPIAVGGWKINGSNNSGTIITRLTINTGAFIPAHGHFLATNSTATCGVSGTDPCYSGSVPGDQTYTLSIVDNGGIAILDASNNIVDQVGMSGLSAYGEGNRLSPLLGNQNQSYERKPGGGAGSGQDTDDNATDFQVNTPSDPENLSSPPVPPLTSPTATFTATQTGTSTRTSTATNTSVPTGTPTLTPMPTSTATFTVTPTNTPITGAVLVGHVTWQGRPAQPNALQQLPITLTLKLGATEVNYPSQNTDASGFFSVSVGSLAPGTYNWRVKGLKFLANAGTVALSGAPQTNVEMGLLRVGDADNNNVTNATDFNIVKSSFGKAQGDVGYDDRADFNGDLRVNSTDFNLFKTNFGQGGAGPIGPQGMRLALPGAKRLGSNLDII